jgi:hypothetical protein
MKKLLLCKPHGGLNDILCQIEKCLKYALAYDRELYIDGSHSGFLDSFENYFAVPAEGGIYFKNIDFLTPPFDVYPHCLSDNITTFKWKFDLTIQRAVHIPTDTVLSFDFDKSYTEQILVHEQGGGGDNSINAFEKLMLKENIRLHISKIIENLGEYDAIHVRHSDYKTDYENFFSDISDKLGDKIVLCTDSYECQVYAKSLWKERLQIVTNIPNTQGKPLHNNRNLDRFAVNLDTLTDLFVLACSKNLHITKIDLWNTTVKSTNKDIKNLYVAKHAAKIEKGFISGFGRLASSLHKRKGLIEKLLWNKKVAVDTPNTSHVPSSKNNLTGDMMYDLVDNLCKKELLIDIAPFGKANQSSLSRWSKPDDAQRAVQKGEWDFAFHTDKEQNPWWELTLDRPSPVEYIVLHNRKSMCQEKSRKLLVEVFEGEKYHQIYQGDLLFGSEPSGLPLILPVKYSKKIEKIKITLQANEYLHLSRVNILSSDNSKKYLCAFADSGLGHVKLRFEEQARLMGYYNKVFFYTENDLSDDSKTHFSDKLKVNRGFGYWVWKPQIILQTLEQLNEGDILNYCDAGCHLNPRGFTQLNEYFTSTNRSRADILAFNVGGTHTERKWTKGDLFDYFGVRDREDIYNSVQALSGIIFIKKSTKSINIIKQWLQVYYDDFSLVDDTPSKSPNFSDFIENRHDQSIFSLLAKINNFDIINLSQNEEIAPILALRDRKRIKQ